MCRGHGDVIDTGENHGICDVWSGHGDFAELGDHFVICDMCSGHKHIF